jgi:enoyl-CoA hydratase/carnithine racemase
MTSAEGREFHQTIFRRCNELMIEIVKAPVPVIAVVDGPAFAAGVQLGPML